LFFAHPNLAPTNFVTYFYNLLLACGREFTCLIPCAFIAKTLTLFPSFNLNPIQIQLRPAGIEIAIPIAYRYSRRDSDPYRISSL
jgi:hypothetical protein